MAKITLGSMVTDARGSVAGVVYSRNKGGNYTRRRVAPINVKSPKQTAVRAAFATNSKLWSGTLTAAQRSAWTSFAAANPLINILGASIIVSGLAMMMKLNQVLAQIGSAAETDPPADLSVPALAAVTGITLATGAPGVTITTAAQTVVAGAKYYVFVTPPLAAGKTPQKSDYRFLGAYAAVAAAVIVDIDSDYSAAYPGLITGNSVGILVATVNTATGAVTPGLVFNGNAT
jgi:hypothetical protein